MITETDGYVLGHEEIPSRYQKTHLLYSFPEHKGKIAALNYERKQEWYASRDPKDMVWLGNDKDFQRFWYWTYLFPLRIKRFFFKVKNWQFKKHPHVTEMKKRLKKHGI